VTLAVGLFGLFVAVLGIAGVLSPRRLLARVTRAQSQMGLYSIAALRLLVGVALWLAAPDSRASSYLQLVGVLALVSGALTPFFGVRRFEAILGWWRKRSPWVVRLWSSLLVLFGLSLVWAVFPVDRAA
jgi:hypothetical protein